MKKNNILKRVFSYVSMLAMLVVAVPMFAHAADNGSYKMVLIDDADLLTAEEEVKLKTIMSEVLPYGNVGFVTNDASHSYSGEAGKYCESLFRQYFGKESGTLFLIDMYNRRIQIFSDGKIYRTITKTRANEITDNVYTYATNENYFQCAEVTFRQIITLLDGGKIAAPMRFVTNGLIALALVLLVNFAIVYMQRFKSLKDTIKSATASGKISAIRHVGTHMKSRTRTHHSSDSGSGSSGGGGGGGSSGGGGGHSF